MPLSMVRADGVKSDSFFIQCGFKELRLFALYLPRAI